MNSSYEIGGNVNQCVATVDSRGFPYGVRLKKIRESSGKSPEELATQMGISLLEYDELEAIAGILNRSTSLAELSKLSSALGVSTRFIFEDEGQDGQPISPSQLCAKTKAYLNTTGLSIAQFEARVGFEIESSLKDAGKIMDWNVDCLRFVCAEIGANWLLALV